MQSIQGALSWDVQIYKPGLSLLEVEVYHLADGMETAITRSPAFTDLPPARLVCKQSVGQQAGFVSNLQVFYLEPLSVERCLPSLSSVGRNAQAPGYEVELDLWGLLGWGIRSPDSCCGNHPTLQVT